MNTKRFVLSCSAVFIFVFAYEWIFHGVLLKDIYAATATLWRPEAQMGDYIGWMVTGQLGFAVLFCYIFTKGYENRGIGEGIRYGLLVGLLLSTSTLIMYAVQPFPLHLVVYWIVGGLIELIVAGMILSAIYRPAGS